ncbi:hypothetical protein NKR23_g1912 [Pleurostoma richardsiae]|uniref:Uncharacterized protein n=1 Tax=Pleurostoma richardsiae TaxID=41990 RepID=A0AA38RY17_9PEZI|nr:hypothetical protein NKR23_g1912 [Pleurostoma richardsiae]
MKPFVLLSLVAAALAAPADIAARDTCKPATYGCAKNPTTGAEGWQVCDVTGVWVYAGDCPPNTKCQFLALNGSPYCIP